MNFHSSIRSWYNYPEDRVIHTVKNNITFYKKKKKKKKKYSSNPAPKILCTLMIPAIDNSFVPTLRFHLLVTHQIFMFFN